MGVDTSHGNQNMDYVEHERTYGRFVWLTKWTIASIVVVLIGMALFLV